MDFRNPELQRLLDSLKDASHSTTSQARRDNDTNVSEVAGHHVELTGKNTDTRKLVPTTVPPNVLSSRLQLNEEHSKSVTPLPRTTQDASNITTWPAAVKYVAKHIVNNEPACVCIKHLINEQQKHEQQWWTQREAIITKHNGRAGNNAKVAEILKGLGGLAAPNATFDESADKLELEAFDKKVYKSLVQMTGDFDGQLRRLGIPFYAIKHDLVVDNNPIDNRPPRMGTLDKGELRDLQRRILQYLEDLLMDE